mgnify:CR=1 FL=1
MTKIDIFSGFLGAGKTTLIKKLIQEAYKGMRINLASAMKRIVALMGTAHGIHDHALLLDAMKAHDKAQAERIMEQHILSTIDAIKQYHPNN